MFVRKKPNKSGSISVQIIDKSFGKYALLQTVGSATEKSEIDFLVKKAKQQIRHISGQTSLPFDLEAPRCTKREFMDGEG